MTSHHHQLDEPALQMLEDGDVLETTIGEGRPVPALGRGDRTPGLWVKAASAEHCAAVGRDGTEIERTNLQQVAQSSVGAWGRKPESADRIVERFGRLAEAGAQHVIINTAEAHDLAAIELLGRDVLPQLRGVEATDPRRLASATAEAS